MAEMVLSGMAGEIRSSIESDQFDLGGYTETRATELMKSAFSTPLTAPTSMVKFTFVVGGGKLVRSRYNDDLLKWVCTALRDIGYTEDKSAAETFDSQKTYKYQHDTGQNLKYVIVYPAVACADVGTSAAAAGGDAAALDTNSKEYIVTACEVSTFREIVASETVSWRQRKRLLKVLQEASDAFQAIEAKLISGAPLTPKEQAIYDANTGGDAEKITWLQSEIKNMVETGQITQSEKDELSKTLQANADGVAKEIETATAEGAPAGKLAKLEEKRQAILTRKAAMIARPSIVRRLKHAEEILKLRTKILPLAAIEDKGRSQSLTLGDLKALEEKSSLEEQVLQLENSSRGWYEDEADFTLMCNLEIDEAKKKYAAKVKAQKAKPGIGKVGTMKKPAGGGGSAWSSVASAGKKTTGASASKPKAAGFGSLYESDSD